MVLISQITSYVTSVSAESTISDENEQHAHLTSTPSSQTHCRDILHDRLLTGPLLRSCPKIKAAYLYRDYYRGGRHA